MDNQTKYFLDKLQEVNLEYLKETENWLLKLYHLVLCDMITLDDVCEIGERYGLNIEERYDSIVSQQIDEDMED